MDTLLKTAAGLLVILNGDRQIVAINHSFLGALGIKDCQKVLGLRLGETIHCVNAFEPPNGCGTTKNCRTCGAAIAMMSALKDNKDEQICALVSEKDGDKADICLKVKAEPIELENQKWVLFYAQDITRLQFWANLDRVFFHDINNILTSLYGNVQLLELSQPDNNETISIRKTIERLINEVAVQKNLAQHKDSALQPVDYAVSLSHIRKEIEFIIRGHTSMQKIKLIQTWPDQDMIIKTDPLLLSRILGNMVINALEATEEGGFIRLLVKANSRQITWEVWNKAVIPQDFQPRIFQRYFSSKSGSGRGLGTYSMKLFGETYLGGEVSFISTKSKGTIFKFTLPVTNRW